MFGRLRNWLNRLLKASPPRPLRIVAIDVRHSLGQAESRRRIEVADKSFATQIPPWIGGTMADWKDGRLYYSEHGIRGYLDFADDCQKSMPRYQIRPCIRRKRLQTR
jgi:hypothetical protein